MSVCKTWRVGDVSNLGMCVVSELHQVTGAQRGAYVQCKCVVGRASHPLAACVANSSLCFSGG
jgi:hypothetical protein